MLICGMHVHVGIEDDAGVFTKVVVGMDYTPVPWWYINIQYLHGVPGTNGDHADTIQGDVTDNGNTGAGGGPIRPSRFRVLA